MLLIAPHCCFSLPWAWASHKALPETLSPDLNKSERQNYLVLWFLAKHIHKKYRKLLDILLQIAGPFTARETVALAQSCKNGYVKDQEYGMGACLNSPTYFFPSNQLD